MRDMCLYEEILVIIEILIDPKLSSLCKENWGKTGNFLKSSRRQVLHDQLRA